MEIKDTLKMHKNGFSGEFAAFTGKSGDYFVSVIPSLQISGYGGTIEDSLADLEFNITIFGDDMKALSPSNRIKELERMGWKKHTYLKKRLSNAYIDENGVLQNFDNPDTVEKKTIQRQVA